MTTADDDLGDVPATPDPAPGARRSMSPLVTVAVITGIFTVTGIVVQGFFSIQARQPVTVGAVDAERQGEPPLVASADVRPVDCRSTYVLPPQAVPTGEGPIASDGTVLGEPWRRFVNNSGAVPAASVFVEVHVQGTGDAAVTLTAVTGRIVGERRPPIVGPALGLACGGPLSYQALTIDLDRRPPTTVSRVNREDDLPPDVELEPVRFPRSVSASDAEPFLVEAVVSQSHVSWVIDIAWESQGRSGTLTVDDAGEPFQITSRANVDGNCGWGIGGDLEIATGTCPY